MPFAGTTAPTGYLLCDGSAVSRTTYAALFAAMGTAYGSGDGSTTYNLPDLRGRFLRGVDGTAGSDPDKTSRTASGTGGNTGNNVGSLQGNSIASHSHALLINLNAGSAYGSSVTYLAGGTQNSEPFWYTFSNSSNTVSIQSSGGNETRPINVYVNYIIKY
ncbi:MAG: tail fiber protein [Bacteroidia bacterium]|nr:tail fiber protein [Bacteroidia bacterium]